MPINPAFKKIADEMVAEDDALPDGPIWNGQTGADPPPADHPETGNENDPPPAEKVLPFQTFDAGDWEGINVAPRRWCVLNRIPAGEPGIMSGDGGTGKTKLMLQLSVAVSAELPDWVNGIVEAHGPVIFYSAEEKPAEMHRRVADILAHRSLAFLALAKRLLFVCDPDDVALAKADHNGGVTPTKSLLRLEKTVKAVKPALVVIENAAEVFVGNENDRTTVSRFVRRYLGGLGVPSDAAIALIQHPSVSGLNDNTGRSGSTAWNNAGRWRLNFTRDRSEETDSGLRQLEVVKANYGPTGEKVRLRWERGVFVPKGTLSPASRAAAEAPVDGAFIRCLDAATAQGRSVGPKASKSWAPSVFERMPEANGFKCKALEAAMERLFSANRIRVEEGGPPSKRRERIVRC